MFRLFNNNSLVGIVLLPLIVLLMHLAQLMQSLEPVAVNDAAPLWQSLLGGLAQMPLLSRILAALFIIVLTMIVGTSANRYHFVQKPCMLAGLYFALPSANVVSVTCLEPVHIFVLCLLLALRRLFNVATLERPMRNVFEAAAIVSLGSLFWSKGVWAMPLFLVVLPMLRIMSARSFVAMLLGFCTPTAIVFCIYFLDGQATEVISNYLNQMTTEAASLRVPLIRRVFDVTIFVLLCVAALNVFGNMNTLKIVESLYSHVVIFIAIAAVVAYFLPLFDREVLSVLAMCAALLMASAAQRVRSYWLIEGLTLALTVFSFVVQWYV